MPRGLTKKNRPADEEFYDVSVTVKFTEAQVHQMNERKRETGVPISAQIRRAIERDLVSDAQPAPPPDTLTLQIKPTEQEKLHKLGRGFGYRQLTHFIEDLALRSLDKTPRAVQEYLLAEFLRESEEVEAKERARLQARDEARRDDDKRKQGHGKAA
jgi:hypothetical protein